MHSDGNGRTPIKIGWSITMHYNFSELIIKDDWIWKRERCGHIPVDPCLQDWGVADRVDGRTPEKNNWVYLVVVRAHGWVWADAHRNWVV